MKIDWKMLPLSVSKVDFQAKKKETFEIQFSNRILGKMNMKNDMNFWKLFETDNLSFSAFECECDRIEIYGQMSYKNV